MNDLKWIAMSALPELDNDFVIRIIIRRQKFIEIFWPISRGRSFFGRLIDGRNATENASLFDSTILVLALHCNRMMPKTILKERKRLLKVTLNFTNHRLVTG